MIKVFYGDDRGKALAAAQKFLGGEYEVIDAAGLAPGDLPSVFQGATLFDAGERRILVWDFLANSAVSGLLVEYAGTMNRVALLEFKVDKRGVGYKTAKEAVEFVEFKMPEQRDFRVGYEIYRTAKRDGKRAVEMLAPLKVSEEPMVFLGVLVSAAMKDFAARPNGAKERRVLKELARVDMQIKSTGVEPWILVDSFLLRLSSL